MKLIFSPGEGVLVAEPAHSDGSSVKCRWPQLGAGFLFLLYGVGQTPASVSQTPYARRERLVNCVVDFRQQGGIVATRYLRSARNNVLLNEEEMAAYWMGARYNSKGTNEEIQYGSIEVFAPVGITVVVFGSYAAVDIAGWS